MKEERNKLKDTVKDFLQDIDDYLKPLPPLEPPRKTKRDPLPIIPTHKIKSYKDDWASIEVPKCYRVDINQYLGEQQDDIFQILGQHKKNILYANAGTGKNTLMINLAKSGLVQRLGCERLIIVVLVTTVGQQSQKDFAKQGIDACFVAGPGVGDKFEKGVTDYELGTADVIICVADSLPRISGLIGNSFFVIDEFDGVGRYSGFRPKMNGVFEYSLIAKRVLLMSATPDLLYTTNLHKGFNYNLIHCVDNSPNKKILSFVECSDKISRIDKLEYLENIDVSEISEGTVIIKLDNKIHNEATKKSYQKRGVIVDNFNSGDPKNKELNSNYQNLVSSGYFAVDVQIIITTKLIDTGVSIKNPVALIGSLDSRSWQEITQLSARPRHNVETGVNMNVKIIIFVSKQTKPKDTKPKQINRTRVEQRFCALQSEAQAQCKQLNSFAGGGSTTRTTGDIDTKLIAFDTETKEYYPSIPQILYELHRQETNETNLPLLKKKIERIDKRFVIDVLQFEKVELSPELEQLQSNIKASKDAQKIFRADYIELLKNDTTEALNAYMVLSKNIKLREHLQTVFQTGLLNKHSVSNFISQNPVAVACKDKGKIISYLAKLVNIGIEKDLILDMLATEKQKNLKQFADSKIVAWRHKQGIDLPARDKLECKIDKAIIEGVNELKENYKKGKYKTGITKKNINNIVKKRATIITDFYKNPILTDIQCFSRFNTLFEFKAERKTTDNKKITIYKIGKCKIELRGRKSLKKVGQSTKKSTLF